MSEFRIDGYFQIQEGTFDETKFVTLTEPCYQNKHGQIVRGLEEVDQTGKHLRWLAPKNDLPRKKTKRRLPNVPKEERAPLHEGKEPKNKNH